MYLGMLVVGSLVWIAIMLWQVTLRTSTSVAIPTNYVYTYIHMRMRCIRVKIGCIPSMVEIIARKAVVHDS